MVDDLVLPLLHLMLLQGDRDAKTPGGGASGEGSSA